MKVDGKEMRPIWFDTTSRTVRFIVRLFLPHDLIIEDLNTVDDVIRAVKEMYVRHPPHRRHRRPGRLSQPGTGKQQKKWGYILNCELARSRSLWQFMFSFNCLFTLFTMWLTAK